MDKVYLIMGFVLIAFGLVSIPVAISKSAFHGCSDEAMEPGFSLLEIQGKHMSDLTVWEQENFCNKNTIFSMLSVIVVFVGSIFILGSFMATMPRKCQKCGVVLDTGDRYCNNCGEKS